VKAFFKLFLVSILLLLFVGCGSKSVYVNRTVPPEIDLKGIEVLAVGELKGPAAAEAEAELISMLFDTKAFRIVDRTHLNRILQEQALHQTGAVDEKTALQLGKLLGPAVMIFGQVSENSYREYTRSEEVKSTKEGVEEVTTKYTKVGKGLFQINIRLLSLVTGEILAVRTFTAEDSIVRQVSGPRSPGPSRSQVLTNARLKALRGFIPMVAPTQVRERAVFLTDSDMPELERGVQSIQGIGDWNQAERLFKQAINNNKGNSKIKVDKAWYNLGLVYMHTHRYNEATHAFKQAYALNSHKRYAGQINRIPTLASQWERLNRK
jgi:tetratricopeptide (TPR) repeat protein